MAKIPKRQPPPAREIRRRERGVALVIVLGALALISFLVLTILTLNRAEQRAAINSTELTDVRTLAELPSQIVISQIRRATHNLGAHFNWTSQPGLIRVFTLENPAPGAQARLLQYRYPLYSTQALYAEGALDLAKETAELAQWANAKALFVDLNEPVEIRQNLRTGAPLRPAEQGTLVFPILDPLAFDPYGNANESRIQGMAHGALPAASARHQMPMPVRWLYVLSNGKVLAPLPSSGPTQARFNMGDLQPENGEPAPRLIGRIAFWTDDESCKVNLNTASEPAPWHPPMTASARDRHAADSQPMRGEHHRLSGHPAYTALSPVLRGFGGLGQPPTQLQPQSQPPDATATTADPFKDYVTTIHGLLPHTPDPDTGSVHGTEIVDANTQPPPARTAAGFSNVDEFLFDPGVPYGANALRQRNGYQAVGGYALDEADIRRARFCLTTHSSAPETNPFNQPKISLWPMQADAAQRTRTDQLMALAATLGGAADGVRPYYGLVRDAAWTGAATPGSSHHIRADLDNHPRNWQLFDWLKTQTSWPFPASTDSFEDKYGTTNRDHLLLSMFDLMRWSSNPGNAWADIGPVYDYLAPVNVAGASPEGSGMVAPLVDNPGTGPTLRSPGRIPTITEAAIVFIATNATMSGGQVEIDDNPDSPFHRFAKQTTEVRAFIVLEPFLASPGLPAVNPTVRYVLKGLNGPNTSGPPDTPPEGFQFTLLKHSLHGQPLIFGDTGGPYKLINRTSFSPSLPGLHVTGGSAGRFGGDATSFSGLTAFFVEKDGRPRLNLGIDDPDKQFPWASNKIIIDPAAPPVAIPYTGGDVLLEIIHTDNDTLRYQEIVLPFGRIDGDLPVPRLHPDDFHLVSATSNDAFILQRFELQAVPGSPPGTPPRLPLIKRGDVVRSITLDPNGPHRGDVRLAAARYQVPREWFALNSTPPPAADVYESHGLREGAFDPVGQIGTSVNAPLTDTPKEPYYTAGSLLDYGILPPPPSQPLPAIPQGVTAALARADFKNTPPTDFRYGDWETGTSILPDGPFFSRQDLLNPVSQADARRGISDHVAAAYTNGGQITPDDQGLGHTPQRQAASAFIFGALTPYVYGHPKGHSTTTLPAQPDPEPWRTLLFCPNPASRTTPADTAATHLDHPGFDHPADYLWLDFFWTPVVEPAFLSPAFSTQGKINMNFQMIPFTWIERTTALHAAFKGVRIPAIPHNARELYKAPFDPAAGPPPDCPEFLYEVDTYRTLDAFRGHFAMPEGVFIHPSQICGVPLMPKRIEGHEDDYDRYLSSPPSSSLPFDPKDLEYAKIIEWWNGDDPNDPLKLDAFELTGDNLRESPYAQIYPRLCTRSNVFKVHYRVQLISKSRGTPANEWDIATEKITAEQRGAAVIERYLDPNDPGIPDMTAGNIALDEFYRYRIISTEPFTP